MNGAKKPNKAGKDRFRFLYCPYSRTDYGTPGQISPYKKSSITTREQALSYCKKNGLYCTFLLSIDGWEFKSDYPRPGEYANDETVYVY